MLFEKASSPTDYQAILLIMNKGISKRSSNHISNSHLLLYYRGMCYFNLKEFEKAEKDFTEGITVTE